MQKENNLKTFILYDEKVCFEKDERNSPYCPSLQTQEREYKKSRKKSNSICQVDKYEK